MKQKRTVYRRNGKVVWGRYNSRRKPGHDYRSNGYYFVTLNTKDRLPILARLSAATCRPHALVQWFGSAGTPFRCTSRSCDSTLVW